VRDRGLPAIDIEQRGLDADQPPIRSLVGQLIADLAHDIDSASFNGIVIEAVEGRGRLECRQCARDVDAIDIDDAAVVPRRNRDDAP
jgi:hypothetical protein